MKTYMFPGQGSQARGMGGSLFDEFQSLTEQADSILGYSIKELCLDDPRGELGKTQFTQPALFVVNALSYFRKVQDSGKAPDYVAGHSLGEFNALLAAECFDFETGVKLVKKRGELMSQTTDGSMAAILNAPRERIEDVLRENGLTEVDVANYNTPMQIVISGPTDQIAACQDFFQFDNVMYIPLNTSGAFHSRLMQPAQEKFRKFLKRQKFNDPNIPVIANLTAQPYPNASIVDYLSRQICSSVLWSDSIRHLLSIDGDMEFEEVGHGDVLTKMIPKIRTVFKSEQASTAAAANAEPKQEAAKSGATTDAAVIAHEPAPVVLESKAGAAPKVSAEQKVLAWNRHYPIGTKARSKTLDYGDLVTRTPATVLFGHRAAVYMEGYNGYFDLDEVEAA